MELQLKNLFFRGLVVGPEESLDSFQKRIEQAHKQPSIAVADFFVDWVDVKYSSKGLRFWEGACSWIGQDHVQIQLQSSLEHKSSLYKIYTKQELLQHEAIHAIRVKFNEPQFEEVLAYQTSTSKLRSCLGPIFRSPKESFVCVILLTIFPFFPLWIAPLLATTFILAGWRLHRALRAFKVTVTKLSHLTSCSSLSWVFALTDAEIWHFSKVSESEILLYIRQQKELRWQQLKAVFLCHRSESDVVVSSKDSKNLLEAHPHFT